MVHINRHDQDTVVLSLEKDFCSLVRTANSNEKPLKTVICLASRLVVSANKLIQSHNFDDDLVTYLNSFSNSIEEYINTNLLKA